MNIFKILSSGDQKLKEPAVTSFMAYLLDPYESHGLKTAFLEYFLKPILENKEYYEDYKELLVKDKTENIRIKKNLIYYFDFFVDIEVSRYLVDEGGENRENNSDNQKQKTRNDIDIVICIEAKENSTKKYYFLIENKLNDGAIGTKKNQLKSQLDSFYDEFNCFDLNPKDVVSTIFLTQKSDTADKYFEDFIEKVKIEEKYTDKVIPTHHHYWKTEKESIYSFLKNILADESVGLIEPLQDYTKHTLKAFMNFIETNFKSRSDDKDESNTYKKKYYHAIDEIFNIWGINDENKFLTNKILEELKNEGVKLSYTNALISIKKPKNICGIFKPAKTIKSTITCFIKNNSEINYDNDYKLAKDGYYYITVNEKNIDKFIQNARELIRIDNK